MGLKERAEILKTKSPQLIAELTLFPKEQSARTLPILPGWGCPCFSERKLGRHGWDGWPMLGDEPLAPGATRTVGFFFLSEAGEDLATKPSFYLWEGGFIGEAKMLEVFGQS